MTGPCPRSRCHSKKWKGCAKIMLSSAGQLLPGALLLHGSPLSNKCEVAGVTVIVQALMDSSAYNSGTHLD